MERKRTNKRRRPAVDESEETSPESALSGRERQSVRPGQEKTQRGGKNPRKKLPPSRPKSGLTSEERARADRFRLVKIPERHKSLWKPLPPSVTLYLTEVLDKAEQKVLTQKLPHKQACKQHLSILKQRILTRCATLRAPKTDIADFKHITKLHSQRSREYAENTESLNVLQSKLDEALESLEKSEEKMDRLMEDIDLLRSSLGDPTTSPQLQKPVGVLDIPDLWEDSSDEGTLQERLGSIPNRDLLFVAHREAVESSEGQNLLSFLRFAREKASLG